MFSTQVDWPELFATGCWCIWRWRNLQIHDDDFNVPQNVVAQIREHWRNYTRKCQGEGILTAQEQIAWIDWEPPPLNWFKVNVDGVLTSRGEAACGGVIRGHIGEWIMGFSQKLNVLLPVRTELIAIREGLTLCWELGIRQLVLESDAKQAVDGILAKELVYGCNAIMKDIADLLSRDWEVVIKHIYREGNQCADLMARIGLQQSDLVRCWSSPPEGARLRLSEDKEGRCTPRQVRL